MGRKEGALVCVFLDSAGHQEKQSEETVQPEKDPRVRVKAAFVRFRPLTSLLSLFVNDLQPDSPSKGSRSCTKIGASSVARMKRACFPSA